MNDERKKKISEAMKKTWASRKASGTKKLKRRGRPKASKQKTFSNIVGKLQIGEDATIYSGKKNLTFAFSKRDAKGYFVGIESVEIPKKSVSKLINQ